jgi:hypothetical protein
MKKRMSLAGLDALFASLQHRAFRGNSSVDFPRFRHSGACRNPGSQRAGMTVEELDPGLRRGNDCGNETEMKWKMKGLPEWAICG